MSSTTKRNSPSPTAPEVAEERRTTPGRSARREELVRANGSIIFRETQDLSFFGHVPPACQVALPSFCFPVSYKEGRAHERRIPRAGGVKFSVARTVENPSVVVVNPSGDAFLPTRMLFSYMARSGAAITRGSTHEYARVSQHAASFSQIRVVDSSRRYE